MPQNKSLLVIVPTRGRPELCREMVESFHRTKSPNTKLLLYFNQDDPRLNDYHATFPQAPQDTRLEIGPRDFIANVYNQYSALFSEYDYYANLNDDHLFITPQWDEKLIDICETQGNGWGIACADDHLTDWDKYKHPSGCVISGKMTRVLGWIAPPGVRHIGIDVVQGKICQAINCLFRDPNIVIEHRHWVNSKRPMDDNYRWVYSNEEQGHGDRAVAAYLHGQFNADVQKLKDAIAAEKR